MHQSNRFGIISVIALLLLLTSFQVAPISVSADANETATGSSNATQQASITSGPDHTCVVLNSGAAKCWGSNYSGELGDNTLSNKLVPTDAMGLTTGVTAVTAGGDNGSPHTCALIDTGAVKCWGLNFAGQLGDNTTSNKLIPTDVTGLTTGVTAITAGMYHTCALLNTGAVKCWGDNSGGQLGDNTTSNKHIPTDVIGLASGVTAVAAGLMHTCALLDTGAVKCWGSNSIGQLGDNSTINKLIPTNVSGLSSGVTAVAAAGHTCALLSTGAVKCWGDNSYGQLGDNTTNNKLIPTQVAGLTTDVTAITTGNGHTCVVLNTGAAKCWGDNSYGQLGDNTTNNKLIPTQVAGLTTDVTAITTGNAHTCVVLNTGAAKCWGSNSLGQLGDNTITDKLIPTQVAGLTTGVGITTTSTTTVAPTTTIVPTTTSVAPTTTTSVPTTTIAPTTTTVEKTMVQLPDTGDNTSPLVALAAIFLSVGLVVATRKRIIS